jgi:hypothetical protein
MAQAVKSLPHLCEALSANPSTIKQLYSILENVFLPNWKCYLIDVTKISAIYEIYAEFSKGNITKFLTVIVGE